jgi:hypothetical protein
MSRTQQSTTLMQDDPIRQQVAEHAQDLAELRAGMAGLRANVDTMAETTRTILKKMDGLAESVGQRGRASVSDIASWLQVVVLLGAIIGSTVTGIVYISGNANASKLGLLEYRMDRMYGSFGWEPLIRKTAP